MKTFDEKSKFVVTTSHKPHKRQVVFAKRLARILGCGYVKRRILGDLIHNEGIDFYYVVEKDLRVVIRWDGGELFFHPSVAKVRMKNITSGGRDYLIESLELKGNEYILDLTFGLGAEAILMAAFLESGRVIGVEKSRHIYNVMRYGMKMYRAKVKWINDALKKIYIVNYDFKKYLRNLKSNSFDIVYCDPMFENPKYESSSMNPLRPFASYDTIDEKDVKEMLRVARKKVVIKSHEDDTLLDKLGLKFDKVIGSPRSGVLYASIEKQNLSS